MAFRIRRTLRHFIFRGLLIATAVSASVFWFAEQAAAQYRPPLSPWLSLFNDNRGGVLSNYHTFVLPRQQIIQEFQTQERQIQSQAAQQQQLQGEVDKVLIQPRKTQSLGGNRAAGFGQHLHYYQGIPVRPYTRYGYR